MPLCRFGAFHTGVARDGGGMEGRARVLLTKTTTHLVPRQGTRGREGGKGRVWVALRPPWVVRLKLSPRWADTPHAGGSGHVLRTTVRQQKRSSCRCCFPLRSPIQQLSPAVPPPSFVVTSESCPCRHRCTTTSLSLTLCFLAAAITVPVSPIALNYQRPPGTAAPSPHPPSAANATSLLV